jgi:hypothetical protein
LFDANRDRVRAGFLGSARPKIQRLQISAITTTATISNPTNRIMMIPILGGDVRNGMGSELSGRRLCMQVFPQDA